MGISFIDLVLATRGQVGDGGVSPALTGSAGAQSPFMRALLEAQSQLSSRTEGQTAATDVGEILDLLVEMQAAEADSDGEHAENDSVDGAALLALLLQGRTPACAIAMQAAGAAENMDTAASNQQPGHATATNTSRVSPADVAVIAAASGDDAPATNGAEASSIASDGALETATNVPTRNTPGLLWTDALSLRITRQDAGRSSVAVRPNPAGAETANTPGNTAPAPQQPVLVANVEDGDGTALLEEVASRSLARYALQSAAPVADGVNADSESALTVVEMSAPKSGATPSGVIQPSHSGDTVAQQVLPGFGVERPAASASMDAAPPSSVRGEQAIVPNRPVTLDALAGQTVRSIRYLSGNEHGTLSVRLIPESLGEMHIEVHSNGDSMSVRLASSNAVVRHAMEANVQQLRESLARDGIHVSRVEIGANLASQADAGNAGGRGAADQSALTQRSYPSYGTAAQNPPEPAVIAPRVSNHHGLVDLFV